MPRRTQHSYAAGIISEESIGRSDIVRYGIGAADLRNFVPKSAGDYSKRPGTEYVGEEFIPEGGTSKPVLLVDFDYGTEQSYVLEFGDYYMAPIKDGARILQTPVNVTALTWSSGVPIRVTVASSVNFMEGDLVTLDGLGGATGVNGNTYKIKTVETVQGSEYPGWFTSHPTDENKFPQMLSAEFTPATGSVLTFPVSAGLWMRVDATNCFEEWDVLNGYFGFNCLGLRSGHLEEFQGMWVGNDLDETSLPHPNADPPVGSIWEVSQTQFDLVRDDDTIDPGTYTSGGTATRFYRIPTIYPAEDLAELQWAQTADEMTFTHQNHAILNLTRTDHDNWIRAIYTNHPSIEPPEVHTTYTGTAKYIVSAISGPSGEESLGYLVENALYGFSDSGVGTNQILEWWEDAGGLGVGFPSEGAIRYNIYAQAIGDDRIGFLGSSDSEKWQKGTGAIAPDYTLQPPKDIVYPFFAADQRPRCVTFFQERLWFGNTQEKAQSVFASRIDAWSSFGVSVPTTAADALEREIATRAMAEVRHLVPTDQLLVFTASAVYAVQGGEGGGITPSGIGFPLRDFEGASLVRPLQIKNSTLYIAEQGQRVIDLGYELEADSLVGKDRTMLTDGLLAEKAFVDWSYAKVPHAIIWAVQDDGGMLSLTYRREHDVWGWARHDTQGLFESVVSIRESFESGVYFVVKRYVDGVWKRYIERLDQTSVTLKDPRAAKFLDGGLSLDVPDAITFDKTATDPLRIDLGVDPTTLTPPYAVDDKVDLEIWIRDDQWKVTPGPYHNHRYLVKAVGATYLDLKEDEIDVADQVDFDAADLLDADGELINIHTANVRKCVTSVDGMDHFAGLSVDALIDGNAFRGDEESWLTVSATGTITLPGAGPTQMWASRVRLGLRIVSDFQSLPPDTRTSQFSTLKGMQVMTTHVDLQLLASRGGKIGSGFDALLNDITYYTEEDLGEEMALFTGTPKTALEGVWGDGHYVIRHDDPLPFQVLSATELLDIGDNE